VAIKQSSRSLK
jgi:hypothetical protein